MLEPGKARACPWMDAELEPVRPRNGVSSSGMEAFSGTWYALVSMFTVLVLVAWG